MAETGLSFTQANAWAASVPGSSVSQRSLAGQGLVTGYSLRPFLALGAQGRKAQRFCFYMAELRVAKLLARVTQLRHTGARMVLAVSPVSGSVLDSPSLLAEHLASLLLEAQGWA